jgi:hypothetical protein
VYAMLCYAMLCKPYLAMICSNLTRVADYVSGEVYIIFNGMYNKEQLIKLSLGTYR